MSKHHQTSSRQTENHFLDIAVLEQYALQIASSEGRTQTTEQDWQQVCAKYLVPSEMNVEPELNFQWGEVEEPSRPETSHQRGHHLAPRGMNDPRVLRKAAFRESRDL